MAIHALDCRGLGVPRVIELNSFIIASKWAYTPAGTDKTVNVYDLRLNGNHVVCIQAVDMPFEYILREDYGSESSFTMWIKAYCPNAVKVA